MYDHVLSYNITQLLSGRRNGELGPVVPDQDAHGKDRLEHIYIYIYVYLYTHNMCIYI